MDKPQDKPNQEQGPPQAGNTPSGQDPQGAGTDIEKGDSSYQPGQGGKGGSGYQPGQSEMAGGTTHRPDPNRGTDAGES